MRIPRLGLVIEADQSKTGSPGTQVADPVHDCGIVVAQEMPWQWPSPTGVIEGVQEAQTRRAR